MNEFEGVKVMVAAEPSYERQVLLDLLRGLRIQNITTEETAVAAFGRLALRAVDLLIADAELKPHPGLQLAREIRASDMSFRRIPIVLFSPEVSRAFLEAAEATGVNEILPKPASLQDVKRCISGALLGGGPKPLADRVATALVERDSYPVLKRADWGAGKPKLDRTRRAALDAAIEAARQAIARADYPALRASLSRASSEAAEADPVLKRAIVGAKRLADIERPDARALEAGIAAIRALAAASDRPALREALADALTEAASLKCRRVTAS